MSSGNEPSARDLLSDFVQDAVPEYILDEAKSMFGEGNALQASLKRDGGYYELSGNIRDEDFQNYSPKIFISLAEGVVSHNCNCNADTFAGPCLHVAALALRAGELLSLDEESASPATVAQNTEWRNSFRNLFTVEIEPEAGRHYLILRFFPEPGRLQVEFFRARHNKSGLSSVHTEITLEQIIANPSWCELSPELPHVAKLIGQSMGYFGHRINIPDGLLSWFFWAVRREHYLFWRDTNTYCNISPSNIELKLHPLLDENKSLKFSIFLHFHDLSIQMQEDNSLHGQMPMWVCWKHSFYQAHTTMDTRLIREISRHPPVIPQKDLSEFLDRVWTRIPSSAIYGEEEFLQSIEPVFMPAVYRPKLFLDEEGSLLTMQVQNIYETAHGEFAISGPNPDFRTGSYNFEGSTYLLHRNYDEELTLINTLADMKFQPRSLRQWFLEQEDAINFLLDSYPKLVTQYRVYGEKKLTRYKVRLTQPTINAVVKSNEKEKWFDLKIDIQYNGQSVPLEKIWKDWLEGKRYTQLKDGSYTSLPESWLKKISHRLQSLGLDPADPPKTSFKQFEAPVLDSLLEEIPGALTDSFWNSLRDKIHNFKQIEPVQDPKGLKAELRAYQRQGVAYLNFLNEYGFGGILADEMGLGKTVQTLTFLQYLLEKGSKGPNLIIVPTSVLPNWEREADKFVPGMKKLIIYGNKRQGMFKKIAASNLVLTTYALLRRDLEELQKFEFNCIILDEAQNIKNPSTITAGSVRSINARLRVCLSGTPIENNIFELWSLFEFLMPGFLGAQSAFQRGVVKPIKDGDNDTLDFLRTRVKPFILRRTKAEVAGDLPPKIENVTYCGLEEEQAELYALLARRLREQVLTSVDQKGMAKSQISILDALLKLRQICCHPRLLKISLPGVHTNIASGKFDAFKDMVTDIVEEGHKVLVFSQFVHMLQIIRSWLQLQEIPFAYLDGSSKDRFEQVDRFNNTPSIPIFLISLKAGGTGLNLTSADYVIHYDPWWNPAVENQATDRTHRIGQTRQVFSYKLICQNTVEEKILQLQEKKKDVAEAIIPGRSSFSSLSRDDLEKLFEV
ncbi:MAG: DEAD/DEAH box helicase [Deltaproteobacteria bacterium]|nr:DEAD/DEAH box helicase [Deltaproteobacteria bacterium]